MVIVVYKREITRVIPFSFITINLRKKNIDNIIDGANSNDLSLDEKIELLRKELKKDFNLGIQEILKRLPKDKGGDNRGKEK